MMSTFIIKKYEKDVNISERIKKLILKVLVEEHGFIEYKDNYLQKDYDLPNMHIWYIENQEGNIIATILMEIKETMGELQGVCCEREYRGKNLAQQLLNEVLCFAKRINLEKLILGTYNQLERAIGFYIKNGFIQTNEIIENNRIAKFYELKI